MQIAGAGGMDMKNMADKNRKGMYDSAQEHDACGIGLIADSKGRKTCGIVKNALKILVSLDHRGGTGSEPDTGDGAGILIQISDAFFRTVCEAEGIQLPQAGDYGIGMAFLPVRFRPDYEMGLKSIVKQEGQNFLGWRTVPVNHAVPGKTAKACQPCIRQAFIARGGETDRGMDFERRLCIIRKRAEKEITGPGSAAGNGIYLASLSSSTIVYKGMLQPAQLPRFYPDLSDERMVSAIALVHSRFSTNTFPSWEKAHPNRYTVHNGEINTLRGNINWMRARQAMFSSGIFREELEKVIPVLDEKGSDSAMLDNCLEFLYHCGYSLPHALMMMIPEPWSGQAGRTPERKAFYQYHSCLSEPWDGPAAICFTDGKLAGAVVDRNGLRPARYTITKDGMVVLASETGVLDMEPRDILKKGRLAPGGMLLVDTVNGRILEDEEIKETIACQHPYGEWLRESMTDLEDGKADFADCRSGKMTERDLPILHRTFGYTREDLTVLLDPMAAAGEEPVGSMGDDTPLAVLSARPHLLYDYFRQHFAQVTNPPMDSIRESIVMSEETLLGPEGNLLKPGPAACHRIRLKSPVLVPGQLEKLKHREREGFPSREFPIRYPVREGGSGLEKSMEQLCRAAEEAVREGINILILSDRHTTAEEAPIPALLAVSGLHHDLIEKGLRTRASIILSSAEPREVHHLALLLGYGVDAVCPWLALETIRDRTARGLLKGMEYPEAERNYVHALRKGILKTISKMGISSVQSYRGAQIFEAVGISSNVTAKYFAGTPSKVEGLTLDEIAAEIRMRHSAAYSVSDSGEEALDPGGIYKWRKGGEDHRYRPETVRMLQKSVRAGDYGLYKKYAACVNDSSEKANTLRGLLEFRTDREPVPIEEVESVESIVKRFRTGAMSYGSISREAHEALAVAMNRLGGKSNTGEGGEDPGRFRPDANGDSRCSAIKQVASGRFGVTGGYLLHARELQIKIAQGAKPGEGGQLPGSKVYPWIAEVRHSIPGIGLISPPPHHDIYSIEDLAELIYDLKNANRDARISVKLASEAGVGTIAAGVAKAGADAVVISGHDGGTGSAPRSSIRHAGLPWELGVSETHQTLIRNNLRRRIAVETDGKLMTGRDVAVAALLGAEEYAFATAPLVALGCVMMRVCHTDACPVGIATQNPELRRRFSGDPQYVVNLMQFIAQDLREIMAELGFCKVHEMIGRTDVLAERESKGIRKTKGMDLSAILYLPKVSSHRERYCSSPRKTDFSDTLDCRVLLPACRPALEEKRKVRLSLPVRNTDRAVGTILGSEAVRRYDAEGLPDGTVELHFRGCAGQSFGAFLPRGITMILEGDANDYVGKGLSGGIIAVRPPREVSFCPEENTILGNVAFYGATSGEAYIRGGAGERFCVRNSGMKAVVENVGDHGCEYMTGGRVVVLGRTGCNFAAGMSGGAAYVLDEDGSFRNRCNPGMVDLLGLTEEEEIPEVREMIERHARYTDSRTAWKVLSQWDRYLACFVKVLPRDS